MSTPSDVTCASACLITTAIYAGDKLDVIRSGRAMRCPLLAFRGRVLHNRACLRSVVKGTQITRSRHICALAKNGLTHILSSSFLGAFGCPRSIVECSLGRGLPQRGGAQQPSKGAGHGGPAPFFFNLRDCQPIGDRYHARSAT